MNVRSNILEGAAWLTSFRLITRGIGLVSTLILVRLLLPEDFGLVAMAMSIIMLVEVFTSFGFEVVLIQNQNAKDDHYHTVWTFNLCLGVSMAVLISAMAYPASLFYQDERLIPLLYAISVNYFVGNLGSVRIVDFRKDMQFDKEVLYQLIVKLSGFFVTIPLAIATRSYWALIAGMFASSCAKVIASFWMKPVRPRLTLSRAREIFSFSAWLTVNNALFAIISRAHDFVIGRVLGPKALGIFSVSFEISSLIATELVAPVNRAAFPGYARLSSDIEQFRRTFLDVMACLMIITLPASIGIASTAELFVPLALGESWLESIPVIQILALYGAAYMLSTNCIYVFHALATPRKVTHLGFIQVVLLIPALYFGATEFGLTGAAWALAGVTFVCFVPLMWLAVSRSLHMSVARLLGRFWRPGCASAFMYAVVNLAIESGLPESVPLAIAMLATVALGVLTYVAAICVLWLVAGQPEGGERILFRQAASIFARLKTKMA